MISRYTLPQALVFLTGFVAAALPELGRAASLNKPAPELIGVEKPGVGAGFVFITGGLGEVDPDRIPESSREVVERFAPATLDGRRSNYDVKWSKRDALGKGHVHAQQFWQGQPIVGGELRLHVDWEQGVAEALNGRMASLEEITSEPRLPWGGALVPALEELGLRRGEGVRVQDIPELAYIVDEEGKAQLAWKVALSHEVEGNPQVDLVYIHHETARVLAVHPQVRFAMNRRVFDVNHGTTLPGALLIAEGGTSSDPVAKAAYDNMGWFYN